MNGALVFIIGLIAGTIGGFVACFIYDLKNEAVKRTEFEEFKKTLDFALDDFNNNVITEISDIRNDLGKTFWLDDMTINGINESLNEVTKKVDDHMRWSLGVWNDISHMDMTDVREKLGVPLEPLPEEPYHFEFKDTDEQEWTEGIGDA